jgi:hypothetical protein
MRLSGFQVPEAARTIALRRSVQAREWKKRYAKMSQRSNIDAAVLLKWFFRHNLRNITIRQNRDDVAAQEPRWTTGAFSFGLAPSDYTFGLKA